jgi:hypothetical protein
MTLNGLAVWTALLCTLLAFAALPMALFATGSAHLDWAAVPVGGIVVAAAWLAVAVAGPDDDNDLTGPTADQACAAAIQAVPGGTEGRVEQQTGEGAALHGVAVTERDATKLEVHEDQNFHVFGTEAPDND